MAGSELNDQIPVNAFSILRIVYLDETPTKYANM